LFQTGSAQTLSYPGTQGFALAYGDNSKAWSYVGVAISVGQYTQAECDRDGLAFVFGGAYSKAIVNAGRLSIAGAFGGVGNVALANGDSIALVLSDNNQTAKTLPNDRLVILPEWEL
jgi:hypothetical protein